MPRGARLLVEDGQRIGVGETLARWDAFNLPVIANKPGRAVYHDLVEGLSLRETMDEASGVSKQVVIDWRQQVRGASLRPRLAIVEEGAASDAGESDAVFDLSVDAVLSVANGEEVLPGDIVARIPKEVDRQHRHHRRPARVAELFEARQPKDPQTIARNAGTVRFEKDYKNKRRVFVDRDDGDDPDEYLLAKGKHIAVNHGDWVDRGDPLIDGNPVPHDILRVKASPISPTIWSTRSRASTGSRACASTTSTSR